MIRQEGGKTVQDAQGDIVRGLEVAEYACGFVSRRVFVVDMSYVCVIGIDRQSGGHV